MTMILGQRQPFSIIAVFHCSPVLNTFSCERHTCVSTTSDCVPDHQAHLPPELVRHDHTPRFASILLEHEQVTQVERRAVPIGALEDLERHEGRHRSAISSRPSGLLGHGEATVKAPRAADAHDRRAELPAQRKALK